MDTGLTGKRALILAASGGLGRGVAEALAAEGAHVLLAARSQGRLDEAVAAIRAAGGTADRVVADLADDDVIDTLEAAAAQHMGGVDVLVNNTGGPPPGPVASADAEALRVHMDMMVTRVIALTARLLPGMRDRGWGPVVTIGSSGVIQPIPNLGLSNVLRSALVGWSKSLSNEVAADGVTVNMLLPGRIHTARVDQLDAAAAERQNTDIETVRRNSRATIPAGRYGSVAEFANVAVFLASDAASYVTGSLVRCDGGLIRSV